jgi:DNA invertase Pin-like site-specific DNA recombinase
VVHSTDRLARNTDDLLRIVREPMTKGATLEFLKERLTLDGQADDLLRNLMLGMLAGFALFERALIRRICRRSF